MITRMILLAVAASLFSGLGLSASAVDPVVPTLQKDLQPLIDKHLAAEQAATMKELARGVQYPAYGKLSVRNKAITDPWGGMADLEQHGLRIADAAKKGQAGLPDMIDALSATLGRAPGVDPGVPARKLATFDDHIEYILAVLDRAKQLRDGALAKFSEKDRKFAFAQTTDLMRNFGPQLSLDANTRTLLENDRKFCGLAHEQIDWAKMVGAAKTLLQLSRADFLASLKEQLTARAPIQEKVAGVTGDILYKKETPHGLILFGGAGKNTYDLKVPVALLVDLGGDDHYKGVIASSFDADHGNSVVIDFEGNDTYEGDEFGLATGRLGVGLLLDLGGKDTYKLAPGSGGTGFGGIGILCDAAGDDTYTGSRFTQGAAVGGIGLLFDVAGNDTYTSHGFALGLGGPGGVGAVVDAAGNDSYQCGKKYPSGYNQSDAPNAKPGDPNFQWDAWGLGMGLGRRIFPPDPKHQDLNLAGGVGMVIDLKGNDRYESSNFSQACGYFFGVGLVLDLAGDDHYLAARYGNASGAHYGMGLFIDYAGKDRYTPIGPTYNGGCAWDRSVFLCIDAGKGDDVYDLTRSHGLGQADIGSWGIFADLGGNDRFIVPGGMGKASQTGVGVFYHQSGKADYQQALPGAKQRPAGGAVLKDGNGGLFVDRQ